MGGGSIHPANEPSRPIALDLAVYRPGCATVARAVRHVATTPGGDIPQPHGQVLYDLVTGHPDRAPQDLVFLADLTVELRAWPQETWTALGISREVALLAVVDLWRTGHVKGLELGGVSVEEARALGRPPMGYVRA